MFAEDSKICFEFSIDSFCFSIGLGVVCSTDSLLDFTKFHKTSVSLRNEKRVSVGDNDFR